MGRTDLAWAVGLFLCALTLRLLHLTTIRESPFFVHLMLDPLMYDRWGLRIADGAWLGERPFFQDPLYAYFLGGIYAALGQRHVPVVLVQSLLGSLVPPLIYLAAKPWFRRATAATAGGMAVVYLPAIYYGGLILKTWMTVLLVSLFLWLLSRALIRRSRGIEWLWAGSVLGLACLTRGNLILFLPVLVLWLLIDASLPDRWRSVRAALLLTAGTLAVLAPATLHNRIVGGEWILTTSNAGQNFYIGNNPLNRTGEYAPLPFVDPNPKHEEQGFAAEARRRTGRALSAAEISSFWLSESLTWIREQPGDWVTLLWRKLRTYWTAYEVPDNLDYYLYRERAPLLRLPIPGFGLAAPLGLLGAALALRRPGWSRVLLLYLVVYSASVILFFVFSRFRMAMLPALLVFSGFGAVELARRTRSALSSEGFGPVARAGSLFLLFFILVNLPVRAREESLAYRIAAAAGLPVRAETSATAHFNLGVAYAARAKEIDDGEAMLVLAEDQLRAAVDQAPDSAKVRVELGKVLARQQRNREAIAVYAEAGAIEPGDYRIDHALGLLHRRLGELAEAEVRFRRALASAPRHAASATRLGEVLLEMNRPREAAQAFRRALHLAPGDRAARDGLNDAESRVVSGTSDP
jgi:4-amino-4-deoxy-L-arabinose transferase-like glycosyltransferase